VKGLFVLCVCWAGILGCYTSSVRVLVPSAGGTVIIEQEWTERRLTRPDTWPEYLLQYPRLPSSESAVPQPQGEPEIIVPRKRA